MAAGSMRKSRGRPPCVVQSGPTSKPIATPCATIWHWVIVTHWMVISGRIWWLASS